MDTYFSALCVYCPRHNQNKYKFLCGVCVCMSLYFCNEGYEIQNYTKIE